MSSAAKVEAAINLAESSVLARVAKEVFDLLDPAEAVVHFARYLDMVGDAVAAAGDIGVDLSEEAKQLKELIASIADKAFSDVWILEVLKVEDGNDKMREELAGAYYTALAEFTEWKHRLNPELTSDEAIKREFQL